jgi:integrase
LPSHLDSVQIKRVLANCDRNTPIGRRDYAILQLISRVGLRANEVRLICIDDIDWQSGQLTVRGKGGRDTVMPLPKETGAAIVNYLRNGRPRSDSRRLFLRDHAPHEGFANSGSISCVAKAALRRAGIDGFARKGAHLFRHSLATEMLRSGATLREIGQVLRHQNQDTTRIYAKVDLSALRTLALPWPGVEVRDE